MRREAEKSISDGVQYSCDQYERDSRHPGQHRLPPYPPHNQQKEHRGETRNRQGPEGRVVAHPADEDEEAAETTTGQQRQPETAQLQQVGQSLCECTEEDGDGSSQHRGNGGGNPHTSNGQRRIERNQSYSSRQSGKSSPDNVEWGGERLSPDQRQR